VPNSDVGAFAEAVNEIPLCRSDVRFTSESGHQSSALACPLSAKSRHSALQSLMVLTTLDSDRALLLVEYLSLTRTISSYLASVVTGSFGTMCTIL
jgi:hypothetical protein